MRNRRLYANCAVKGRQAPCGVWGGAPRSCRRARPLRPEAFYYSMYLLSFCSVFARQERSRKPLPLNLTTAHSPPKEKLFLSRYMGGHIKPLSLNLTKKPPCETDAFMQKCAVKGRQAPCGVWGGAPRSCRRARPLRPEAFYYSMYLLSFCSVFARQERSRKPFPLRLTAAHSPPKEKLFLSRYMGGTHKALSSEFAGSVQAAV